MTSDPVVWTYALAPDVEVHPADGGAFLETAVGRTWIERDDIHLLQLLVGAGSSEPELLNQLRRIASGGDDADAGCAALLFRLDELGLLARALHSRGRQLASCFPLRPPRESAPEHPPEGQLRLSPRALARAEGTLLSLEAPGAWARVSIHDRELLPLLHDLAAGGSAAELAALASGHDRNAILALLALMTWCGLLDHDDPGWASHDLWFHTRTRRGYARERLGKSEPGDEGATRRQPPTAVAGGRRLALATPDLPRLLAGDPPFALVSERRQSTRRQGAQPITTAQLSEFLFRTLHERDGRRPYPSGGARYPLNAYLAVHRCFGIAPGIYAYDPALHELITVAGPGPGLDELLADAAGAANSAATPQVLLVLAARYARTGAVYGHLSYSLILKEVGAVFQAAMMAAAAMGLGTCPLGCGNALLFGDLTGLDPLTETSVGEMTLGSRDDGEPMSG